MVENNSSQIEGVTIRPLTCHFDSRGWLAELFRADEWPAEFHPAMAYISLTCPGVTRGPHEHYHQSDLFAFVSGSFDLYLWDNRYGSPSFEQRVVTQVGETNPSLILVPPGVVHAYRNISPADAFVINCPNRLYGGARKLAPVDEIRHEGDARFNMDD